MYNENTDFKKLSSILQLRNDFLKQENAALLKIIYENKLYDNYITEFNKLRMK